MLEGVQISSLHGELQHGIGVPLHVGQQGEETRQYAWRLMLMLLVMLQLLLQLQELPVLALAEVEWEQLLRQWVGGMLRDPQRGRGALLGWCILLGAAGIGRRCCVAAPRCLVKDVGAGSMLELLCYHDSSPASVTLVPEIKVCPASLYDDR